MASNTYRTIIEKLGEDKTLYLNDRIINDDDIKLLVEALKHTQITRLDLRNNNIGCEGLKILADNLKYTQINILNLKKNNLRDEGIRYLAEILDNTKITDLNLSENKISFEAAEYFNRLVKYTPVKKIRMDVYYSENSDNYISQISHCEFNDVFIELKNSDIGIAGSKYINRSFCEIGIEELKFDCRNLNHYHYDNLSKAFKNIKINKLSVTRSNNVKHLAEIFEKSRIAQLDLHSSKLTRYNVNYLVEFLKIIKIVDLDISHNYLRDEGLRILAPVLKNSDIMKINLTKNIILQEGIKHLSKILRDSKIVHINLSNCPIRSCGVRQLLNGLPGSQVTSILLYGCQIKPVDYRSLMDIVNSTKVIADKIENVFRNLVSFSSDSGEFEFKVLKKKNQCDSPVVINQYATFIDMIMKNKKFKVNIIYKMCKNEHDIYNFDVIDKIDKINEFIDNLKNKFFLFVESRLPDLASEFLVDDFVKLIKKFGELELYDIAENLLLHRELYYVDDNQEILYPHIYKLLSQYNLPTYNSEFEPNKKNEIIEYYETNREIDGAQEIVVLLKSGYL